MSDTSTQNEGASETVAEMEPVAADVAVVPAATWESLTEDLSSLEDTFDMALPKGHTITAKCLMDGGAMLRLQRHARLCSQAYTKGAFPDAAGIGPFEPEIVQAAVTVSALVTALDGKPATMSVREALVMSKRCGTLLLSIFNAIMQRSTRKVEEVESEAIDDAKND